MRQKHSRPNVKQREIDLYVFGGEAKIWNVLDFKEDGQNYPSCYW